MEVTSVDRQRKEVVCNSLAEKVLDLGDIFAGEAFLAISRGAICVKA